MFAIDIKAITFERRNMTFIWVYGGVDKLGNSKAPLLIEFRGQLKSGVQLPAKLATSWAELDDMNPILTCVLRPSHCIFYN